MGENCGCFGCFGDSPGTLLDRCFLLAGRAYIALRRSMPLWPGRGQIDAIAIAYPMAQSQSCGVQGCTGMPQVFTTIHVQWLSYIYNIIIDGNSIWLVLFTCEPYIETALLQTPAELGRWVSLLRVTGHAGGAGCSCLRQDANAAVVVVTARAPGRFFEWGLPLWDFLSEVLLSYWAFLSL